MTPPTLTVDAPPEIEAAPAPIADPDHDLPAPSPLRALAADTLVFARRRLQHIHQIPEKLLSVTVMPLMFVLLFAYVFGNAVVVEGGSYREYIVAGVIVQSIAFGLTAPAMSISTDMIEGVSDRFQTVPATRLAYMLGNYVAELAAMVLAVIVLLGAGLIVGWRPHTDLFQFTQGILLLLLFASAMIWLGLTIGLLVRSPDAVMGLAFVIVFPLTFISSSFVPASALPEVLQHIAAWNPVTVMVTALRALFGNPTGLVTFPNWALDHPVKGTVAGCLAMLAVGIPAALAVYHRRTLD
jgi:ABC-2 type transport system permease protein